MKKIIKYFKRSWKENRVLFVLTVILIICLVLIVTIGIDYFLGSSKDKYGERLEGIKKVEINNKRVSSLESEITKDEKVSECKVKQIGKVIYIDIKYADGVALNEAQEKAATTVELFSEKELKFYDLNYTLTQDADGENPGFLMMGSRNVNGSGLVWSNNTPVTKAE